MGPRHGARAGDRGGGELFTYATDRPAAFGQRDGRCTEGRAVTLGSLILVVLRQAIEHTHPSYADSSIIAFS